jgi:hypothetical protein
MEPRMLEWGLHPLRGDIYEDTGYYSPENENLLNEYKM